MEENEETVYLCTFIQAIPCRTGKCYKCKDCENNPEFYVKDPELLKQFAEHPWAPYCMTCGEFDSTQNHPGHIIAVGFEQYREKLPAMIMDRLLRRNTESGDT